MTTHLKHEARVKFLLGGIVVKAGLARADRAFLLGGLRELARVAIGSPQHRRLREIGKEAFKAPSLKDGIAPTEEILEWQ